MPQQPKPEHYITPLMSSACLVLVAFNLVGCQYIAPPDIDTPPSPASPSPSVLFGRSHRNY
ncbi:hypothetical protein [Coleofasciculus sp. FACHB-129]|uniref:hypothetical protein n=1 Tax=Cyanophyceae TaxID=3028117 RepID=UPI001687175F|nr:hypothetical protein [Coleofasciculus sp. FACHB-129]MBD1895910.1 hypothetical protein [Coleofasciculus sp. FACHB-129]